ncbi:MAG: beta-lactamase family protein [Pseudomonadota bacterium]|nr:beta-lactamase family protein [Pseudomonadota bacterium]
MRRAVQSKPGAYLGAVTLVTRDGRIVDWQAYGYRDLEKRSRMKRDDIFRVYSMTKTVATVAVLMLLEEGRLELDDSIGKHLSEFAGRAVTIRELLTHTSGLALATEREESSVDLKAYSEAASRVPQAAPAGSRFEYNSVNTEILSRLVEVLSGKSFSVFLRDRIFIPLRMRDTGFEVPANKRSRIAAMTSTDRDGKLIAWPAGDSLRPGDALRPYSSGAGGLYSTAGDFGRFCQMLLDRGRLEGAVLLRPETVALMMTNQLTRFDPPVSQYNEGFGLGGFVNLDMPGRERPGSVGAFGWSGAAGTYYMADGRERMCSILLTQHLAQGLPHDPPKLSSTFYNLVYQSLSPPHSR